MFPKLVYSDRWQSKREFRYSLPRDHGGFWRTFGGHLEDARKVSPSNGFYGVLLQVVVGLSIVAQLPLFARSWNSIFSIKTPVEKWWTFGGRLVDDGGRQLTTNPSALVEVQLLGVERC